MDTSKLLQWLKSRRGKIVCRILIALAVLFVAYSLLVRAPSVPDAPVSDDSISTPAQGDRRGGMYTFLLVGRDTGGGGNTDTMILVSFDSRGKKVNALSLPRDTMVNVSWRTKKLNTVYNSCKGKDEQTQVENGMAALKSHVGKLTGIYPDFYAMVEWDIVGPLVDAVGGVEFDVPYDMHYDDPAQDLHIHQDKGERRLTGEDAMQVIRWRKNNGKYGHFQVGDAGRMKIQQDFLIAVIRECMQVQNIVSFPEFARIFTDYVETDLSVGNLVWLAQRAVGINIEKNVTFHTMPYTNYARGTAYVLPVVDELLRIINEGMNPYKDEITADDLEVIQRKNNGGLYLTSGVFADKSLGKGGGTAPNTQPAEKPEQQPVEQAPAPVPEETPEQPPVENTEPEPTPEEPPESEPQQTHPEAPVGVLPPTPTPVE